MMSSREYVRPLLFNIFMKAKSYQLTIRNFAGEELYYLYNGNSHSQKSETKVLFVAAPLRWSKTRATYDNTDLSKTDLCNR